MIVEPMIYQVYGIGKYFIILLSKIIGIIKIGGKILTAQTQDLSINGTNRKWD